MSYEANLTLVILAIIFFQIGNFGIRANLFGGSEILHEVTLAREETNYNPVVQIPYQNPNGYWNPQGNTFPIPSPNQNQNQNHNFQASNQNRENDHHKSASNLNVENYSDNYLDSQWGGQGYPDPAGDIGKVYTPPIGLENKGIGWPGPPGEGEDSKCGGVLDVTNIGTLSYKYRRPYEQYESCIWTINSFKRPLIRVNITESYFRSTEDYIAVGYFNKSNFDRISSLTWMVLARDSFTPQSVEVPGPVAFIHFVATASNPGLGFRLTYEAGGEPQNSVYTYDNYFLDGEFGIFKYPPTGTMYNNNQRTTIVVKARNNNASEPSVLNIKRVNIEESQGCSADSLNLYTISGFTWTKNRTFCGRYLLNQNVYFATPRNHPIILTFKSDDSGARSGFELLWRNF